MTQDQNWVRLRKLRTFNSQQSQKHLYLVQNDWEKSFKKCLPPLETEKMTIICALSYKHLLCFWCCCDFKKSPLNFRGIVYQMDHIWWAPSRLKMSLVIILLEQYAKTFGLSLWKTLYTHFQRCLLMKRICHITTATSFYNIYTFSEVLAVELLFVRTQK